MSRKGKTTRALENHPKGPRSICYTAQFTNDLMTARYRDRVIYDTPEYLQNLEKYLETYKDICIIRTEKDNALIWDTLRKTRNCEILGDDITMVLENDWPFMQFLASVGMNNNRFQGTTHVPTGDMPKKARTIAVKVNIVGPWDSEDDIIWLYRNQRNVSMPFEQFRERLKNQKWGEVFTIKE